MKLGEALGRALEIELDHFRRTGTHEEEQLDVRPAFEKAVDHTIEFDIDVGKACEVALVDDRSGKARFGEDQALCLHLLEHGVAVVAASAFGGDFGFRISFATDEDRLTEALRRIAKALT